ncbi:hypothetical protein CLAFUR0_03025 [Fulvia fulva]|nr:hypothetical protein CLAFUR0_03025 [Fulvia fulva]
MITLTRPATSGGAHTVPFATIQGNVTRLTGTELSRIAALCRLYLYAIALQGMDGETSCDPVRNKSITKLGGAVSVPIGYPTCPKDQDVTRDDFVPNGTSCKTRPAISVHQDENDCRIYESVTCNGDLMARKPSDQQGQYMRLCTQEQKDKLDTLLRRTGQIDRVPTHVDPGYRGDKVMYISLRGRSIPYDAPLSPFYASASNKQNGQMSISRTAMLFLTALTSEVNAVDTNQQYASLSTTVEEITIARYDEDKAYVVACHFAKLSDGQDPGSGITKRFQVKFGSRMEKAQTKIVHNSPIPACDGKMLDFSKALMRHLHDEHHQKHLEDSRRQNGDHARVAEVAAMLAAQKNPTKSSEASALNDRNPAPAGHEHHHSTKVVVGDSKDGKRFPCPMCAAGVGYQHEGECQCFDIVHEGDPAGKWMDPYFRTQHAANASAPLEDEDDDSHDFELYLLKPTDAGLGPEPVNQPTQDGADSTTHRDDGYPDDTTPSEDTGSIPKTNSVGSAQVAPGTRKRKRGHPSEEHEDGDGSEDAGAHVHKARRTGTKRRISQEAIDGSQFPVDDPQHAESIARTGLSDQFDEKM